MKHKTPTFNFRGGYPSYIRKDNQYYLKCLFCDNCGMITSLYDYEIALGILFDRGYYCSKCGSKLEYTKTKRITKKQFENEIPNTK